MNLKHAGTVEPTLAFPSFMSQRDSATGRCEVACIPRKPLVAASALALVTAVALSLSFGLGVAHAKGGTAKPPKNTPTPPVLVTPTLPDPLFSVGVARIHGFDATGFIQKVTVDGTICPTVTDQANWGGTVEVNGITVTVPCNSIVQMPANTLKWTAAVDLVNHPPLALADSAKPSFEVSLNGNIVGDKHIAGLVFLSQQSLASGTGVITRIDYGDGSIYVGSEAGAPDQVRLQINDPNGRFGRAQSPDDRFSVDDENPTIHAATGYPMCVPRTDPAVADDSLCPQKNRPKVAAGCRNFNQAGIAPPVSGELGAPAAGQIYCSQYVMKASGTSVTSFPAPNTALPVTSIAGASDADAREQTPFEIGDFVTYSGTLMQAGSVPGPGDYISAHTIEANVGIYTQPGTQPSYLAIGGFGVGTADPNATALSGVPQESQDRIFLETGTTDVKTPVDIYMVEVDPLTGAEKNRWVTPFEMTGENQFGNPSGGITTQNLGPQPQRARIRAAKAPAGLLSNPTRNMRVMVRSLCTPQMQLDQAALNSCLQNAPVVANGLVAGQYLAPVFEFIFPEGVKPGDLPVPYDHWHLGFLRFGEGANTGGVGPLIPTPW